MKNSSQEVTVQVLVLPAIYKINHKSRLPECSVAAAINTVSKMCFPVHFEEYTMKAIYISVVQ